MKGLAIGLGIVVLILGLWAWGSYNGLIRGENAIDNALGNVEAAYQRRLDTIPKFAKNAQFSVDFQVKLQEKYTQGREGVKTAGASGDPAALQKAANTAFDGLMIAVRAEAVPQAKLDQLTELNAQIESVERVINHERTAYNKTVQNYRDKKRTFPGNIIAGIFGFGDREMFKSEPGAEKSPNYDLKVN